MREGKKVGWFLAGFPVILLGELLGVAATLAAAGDHASLVVMRRFFSSLGLP